MDVEDALAGDYVAVMLVVIAFWIAFIVTGITVGGYLALGKLGL